MKEAVFQVYREIIDVQNKINDLRENNQELLEKYTRELFSLKVKLQKLEKDLYLYREPDLSSSEIDLYLKNYHDLLEDNPDRYNYIITLHGTKTKIGEFEIRFSLLDCEKHFGNIGANISDDYRGMRYSQKTFKLLRDVLLEKGLTKPIFTVKEDNLSSIKSLHNMGAQKKDYVNDDVNGNYYIYEYDLEKEPKLK